MKKILTIILLFIGFTSYGQLVTNKGITIDSVSGVANNWVTQYQRKKTSDSLQANINSNTTSIGNKWGITGNSGNSYLTNFLGNTDNVSLRFRTNNLERGKFDSVGNVIVGAGMIIGQQLVDPSNQQSVQYASDGSYPAILQLTTSDSIGCVNCALNGSNITSDSTKRVGFEVSSFNENGGMAFIHFKKARGNWLNPRGVRTGDIVGAAAGMGYLGDQNNFSGSVVGFHWVAVNNFTAAQQSTGIQEFVNNVNARRYSRYVQPTGKNVFYDSTSSTWNPVELGTLKASGIFDNLASDMTVGAVDGGIVRTGATNKVFRLSMNGYVNASQTALLVGVNTSTDNTVSLGGGSVAYHAATQLSFYTAAALATTTGTLAIRVNGAQSVLIGGATADDGSLYKLQVTGGASHTGTLVDQKNAIKVVSTMPSGTATGANYSVNIQTTSVSNTQNQTAFNADILAGATDAKLYSGLRGASLVAGTGANLFGILGNYGVLGASTATTVGYNVGMYSFASGGNLSAGVAARAITAKNSATNIGGAFIGRNTGTTPIQIGVYAGLNSADPTFVSAALLADNSDQTSPIFMARDNGTSVFEIQDGGKISVAATNTATGTTGAQTINKAAGKVNFAAAATTLVVTNSLVTTASIVRVQVEGADATATSARVTLASGSFTITLNAAATAETKVAFEVIN